MKHTKIFTFLMVVSICSAQLSLQAIEWKNIKKVAAASMVAALIGSTVVTHPDVQPMFHDRLSTTTLEFVEGFSVCSLVAQGAATGMQVTDNNWVAKSAGIVGGGMAGWGTAQKLGYSLQKNNETESDYFGKQAGCGVGLFSALPLVMANFQ